MFGRRRGFGGNGDQAGNDGDFRGMTGYEEKTVFSADVGLQNGAQSAGLGASVFDSGAPASLTDERPMVFATRKCPNVYIYEYSDRLEYYVKLEDVMYPFNTVKKALK